MSVLPVAEPESLVAEMSPVAHLQFGWWFAHWGNFSRRERAVIALAGLAPDADGVFVFGGQDVYYRFHHIQFHNVGAALAVLLLAGVFFWRRPRVWLLIGFAFAAHLVEDYITVGWNQHLWLPFSSSPVNLADHLPNWLVQGVFQAVTMVFILAVTVYIYRRHGRTPIEILSPALDRLLLNYVVLPWRHTCRACPRRARFRCDQCRRDFCPDHARPMASLAVRCTTCS